MLSLMLIGCITKSEKDEGNYLFGNWSYKDGADAKHIKMDSATFSFQKDSLNLKYDYQWNCADGIKSPDGVEHDVCNKFPDISIYTGNNILGSYTIKGDSIFPEASSSAFVVEKKSETEMDLKLDGLFIRFKKQ